MSNFQTILVAIFLSFFVFAVLIFSNVIKIPGKSNVGPKGNIVIWGTFSRSIFTKVIDNLSVSNKELNISYVNKNPLTYQQELIEAIANGKGPDLFVVTTDMIKKNNNFIYKIPYESYPEKNFRDSFVEGADIYLDDKGVIAYPLVIDPIVLYYNKDILTNEGIVYPPATWDELFTLNSILTKRDNSGTINQSMIALGQYSNINNAKEILSTLLIQNNNPITVSGGNGKYISMIKSNPNNLSVSPIQSVLKFFIEFSNPANSAYSWNRSLPSSLDMFTSGKLAFYIGRASELFNIESINPNLSFDVTSIPQIKNSPNKRTYGDIYAMAVNNRSTNLTTAFSIANVLSLGVDATNLSIASSLPPASRALIAVKPADPYLSTFFNSALVVRSWVDPNKIQSDLVFKELIENILSNRLSMGESINKAQEQLEILLK